MNLTLRRLRASLPVLVPTVLVAFATALPAVATALEREPAKLPDCNTKIPECREWRDAVELMNRMGGGGGEITPKPRRPADATRAMNGCIRYMQRTQKMTAAQARATCEQELKS